MERIFGCLMGLDQKHPQLPEKVCCHPCEWRVKSSEHNNCCWMVFASPNFREMSLRDIAAMLGITHESVRQILKQAIEKMPKSVEEIEELLNNSLPIKRKVKYSDNLNRDRIMELCSHVDK
jgi:hypothetical protein